MTLHTWALVPSHKAAFEELPHCLQDYCKELQKQIAVLQPNAESRLCQLVLEAMHFRAYCNAFMLKNAQARMEPTPEEAADIRRKVQKVVVSLCAVSVMDFTCCICCSCCLIYSCWHCGPV